MNELSANTSPKPNKSTDWLECAKWLNELGLLSEALKSRLYARQLQLSEFANALRDGELLCLLANRLCPGCIDSSLINRRAHMSQVLCLTNIRLFLDACESAQLFGLAKSDLFDEHMLYDLLDLACVIRTLSILSRTKLSLKHNPKGFSLSGETEQNHNTLLLQPSLPPPPMKELASSGLSSLNQMINNKLALNSTSNNNDSLDNNSELTVIEQSDDIYYNIVPNEILTAVGTSSAADTPESYYTDESFLFNGLLMANDSSAYQAIVTQPSHHQTLSSQTSFSSAHSASSSHQPTKRDFVMREIINTEENFVKGLDTLATDFLRPLSSVLSESDRRIVCLNMDELIRLHTALYEELLNACKGKQGRSQRICRVFDEFKVRLMREYAEYFSNIDKSIAKCDSLAQVSLGALDTAKQQYIAAYRAKLAECKRNSKRGNFNLTDLLRLPYQRVLKYHLLFKELQKQTDVEHAAREVIERTGESMRELGNYLNECQRDKENLSKIELVLKYLHVASDSAAALFTSNSSSSSNLNHRPNSLYSSGGLNSILSRDYGHYIKDGKFRIKSIDLGELYARSRSFFLFEKALIVCKAKGNMYNYKETLLMSEYSIEESLSSSTTGTSATSSSLSTSTSNLLAEHLASGGSQHSLYLVNADTSKCYTIVFKNKEEKRTWKEALQTAKDKVRPKGQRAHKHFFELANFDKELVRCFVCEKYLLGLFYQGYKCFLCSQVAHKDCLSGVKTVCVASLTTAAIANGSRPTQQQQQQPISAKNVSQLDRSQSMNNSSLRPPPPKAQSQTQQQQPIQIARALYRYDGRPRPPPELPALLFNRGDTIQITDDDDDEWRKGFLIKSSTVAAASTEGYFPRSYVEIIPSSSSGSSTTNVTSASPPSWQIYEEYAWFSPVDRIMADLILSRIPNGLASTIFMVRCRQEGGFAISIKYNGAIDHIKVNVHSLSELVSGSTANSSAAAADSLSASSSVYSIDQQNNFNSIQSLVNFYSQNQLKDNFPQLDTTLGVPFRKALPAPISVATAMHDYNPLVNPNNTGEQIELKRGRRYSVLSKEANGWWSVFNAEGLIGYVPGSYLLEIVNTANRVQNSDP